jgi:hypothetical protein
MFSGDSGGKKNKKKHNQLDDPVLLLQRFQTPEY